MRTPEFLPARASKSELAARTPAREQHEAALIEPAGCCAQVCVIIDGVPICHCVAEAPFC
jgi:hypothetical protein